MVSEHPTPNSSACLSDILDDLQVANMTVKVKNEQLKELSFPCIVHLREEKEEYYALLTDFKLNQVYYYDSNKGNIVAPFDDFAKKWTGEVMLVSPDEQSGEVIYAENRKKEQWNQIEKGIAISCLLLVISLGILGSNNLANSLLFLLVSIGAVVSSLLLWSEYGKPPALVAQFCSGKNTSCHEILQSGASKIFGWVSWAEIGVFYFIGSLLNLLFSNHSSVSLLAILSVFALSYTFFFYLLSGESSKKVVYFVFDSAVGGLGYVFCLSPYPSPSERGI